MRNWHEPEDLGREQDERDAAISGRKYFVYVLNTDYGHYVGHTGNLKARIRAHQKGEVPSTAGGHPKRVWTSSKFSTRADAASFEAALKNLRDQRSPRFRELTGLNPIPYWRREKAASFGRVAMVVGKALAKVLVTLIVRGLGFGRQRRKPHQRRRRR